MEQVINIIIWAAIVQGYLLSILFIVSKEYSSWSNKLLGFFLISMLFELTATLIPFDEVFGYSTGQYFELPDTKILFPVLFLHYVLQKLGRVSAYRNFLRLNYTFAIGIMSLTIVNIGLLIGTGKGLWGHFTYEQLEVVHLGQQTYAFLLGIAGIFISIKEVKRYKRIAQNEYADMELLSLDWLWWFVVLLIPASMLWGAELIRIYIGFYTGEFTDWDFVYITYFALVIFIYIVSYQAFRRNDLFALKHDKTVAEDANDHSELAVNAELKEKLTQAMVNEKLFLKIDLTINDVAKAVSTSPKKVSGCVNKAFGTNFSEWVNRYRVDAVKEKINSPKNDYLTIEAIGQESGFKSRSAMYAAFKKFTGESPASLRQLS